MTRETFDLLVNIWKSDMRICLSSNGDAVLESPAFRRVVDEGTPVIPFIVERYKAECDPDWCWPLALSLITNKDPVKLDNYGYNINIRNDWIEWWEKHGSQQLQN